MKEEEFRHPSSDAVKSALKVFGSPVESLDKCAPAFEEFGIDLSKLLSRLGFRSEQNEKLGLQPLPLDSILLGAAMNRDFARLRSELAALDKRKS
jgi:hypothetical protein